MKVLDYRALLTQLGVLFICPKLPVLNPKKFLVLKQIWL